MGNDRKSKIAVVVPVYNESEILKLFHNELVKVLSNIKVRFEIIYINDGSSDDTSLVIKSLDSKIAYREIAFSKNFGKENAILAGLDNAHADGVIVMDADLQHPPIMIKTFIDNWLNGYDIIQAVRVENNDHSLLRRGASKLFYKIIRHIADIEFKNNTTDFCLIDKKVVKAICKHRERRRLFRAIVSNIGFNKIFVEFSAPSRKYGKSKFDTKKLFIYLIDSIASQSSKPLFFSFYVGLIMFIIATFEGIYAVITHFVNTHPLPGWASMVGWLAFFEGIQFLMLGLVGLYLGRVFEEIKGRPLYIVQNEYQEKSKINLISFDEVVVTGDSYSD